MRRLRSHRSRRARPCRSHRRAAGAFCALCAVMYPVLASGPSAAVRAPDRLARAGADVYRLAREEALVRERYEKALPAARERRAEAERLRQRLSGERFVSSVLREDAGAAARAQYRTGGFTARDSLRLSADDPFELLALQETDAGRRDRLARRLSDADDRGRALELRERSVASSWQALDRDTAMLRRTLGGAVDRLAAARDELDGMAAAAVGGGHCAPVDRDALDADDDARPEGDRDGPGWTRPVLSYRLSAGYGGSGANWSGTHTGQDFAVPTGTPVRSVGPGTVVDTGCGGAFGISLVVRHPGGWYSQYAHLAAAFVAPGRRVRPGEWIGLSGTTGNSTGPHLHFEVRTSPEFGTSVDPVEWLHGRGVGL